MKSAVLFLVFNRPEVTARVFHAIRAARPPRLYVAADGPRPGRADEAARCAEVRRIASAVDWPCDVKSLFRDINLGCERGVSSGIDWFFKHELEGIILEDDVLPVCGFFAFCDELLERYRDDDDVAMISGCNLLGGRVTPDGSYFFSRYMHVWGWASWRRAWANYDVTMKEHSAVATGKMLTHVLDRRALARQYWLDIFDQVRAGKVGTWDYQWVHTAWRYDQMAIIPAHNLVANLGFGCEATHTSVAPPDFVTQSPPRQIEFPLVHPARRAPEPRIDRIIERVVYGITPLSVTLASFRRSWPWRFVAPITRAIRKSIYAPHR